MECPFCAEEIAEDALDCPSCGEALDGGGGGGGGSNTIVIVIVCVVVLGLLCMFLVLPVLLMPALMKAKEKANRTKCSNNLRQLGLGALQYGDDKRFFPHVWGITELDGDVTTNDTPRKMRALLYHGYMDSPDVFICPSSMDIAMQPGGFIPDGRAWFWDAGSNPDPSASPLTGQAGDPTLDQTSELSYGWTRKGMNSNVRSTALLGADRAVVEDSGGVGMDALYGNHSDGWNVLRVDATVQFFSTGYQPFPGAWLLATERDDSGESPGFLTLKDQADPTLFR